MLGAGAPRSSPLRMQRLLQTILSPPLGNCFSACLACILELPVESVPNFVGEHGDEWFPKLKEWLESSNLSPIFLEVNSEQANFGPPGYSILSAEIVGSSRGHCLVALDGEVVWDPAPTKTTLVSRKSWVVLAVLDPTVPISLDRLQKIEVREIPQVKTTSPSEQRSRIKELTVGQFLEQYGPSREQQEAWANKWDREILELYESLTFNEQAISRDPTSNS